MCMPRLITQFTILAIKQVGGVRSHLSSRCIHFPCPYKEYVRRSVVHSFSQQLFMYIRFYNYLCAPLSVFFIYCMNAVFTSVQYVLLSLSSSVQPIPSVRIAHCCIAGDLLHSNRLRKECMKNPLVYSCFGV